MDLNQPISNLLNKENQTTSQESKLSSIISQIVGLADKGQSTDVGDEQDIDAIFTQLAEVAKAGQLEIFQELIKAEQQGRLHNEPTLLMAAVMADQLEVVKTLLTAGADPNIRITQFFEFNALSFAIKHENIEIIKALLEAGADPNWSNKGPLLAPIVEAVQKNNIEIVRLYLEYGASIKFDTGFKLLVKAAEQDNAELIQLLLEQGCDVNDSDHTGSALRTACTRCNVEVIKTLLAAGAEISPMGADLLAIFGAPFFAEQMSGLLGYQPDPTPKIPLALQAFIDVGADVNVKGADGTTALILAVSEGYLDIVKMLLSAGANPNLQGNISGIMWLRASKIPLPVAQYTQPTTPLNLAAAFGYADIAQALIDAGADVLLEDEQGRSAITIATKEGHQDIVQMLKRAGAKVSQDATELSAEALIGAAKQGNVAILQSALAAGIDPNTSDPSAGRTRRDKTALMFAAEGGHLEAVKLLVERGAEVNLSDRPGKKLGKTPLMCAAQNNHGAVVQFLLEAGATVDTQDKRGQTALFYAVEDEAEAAAEVLLEFGADPHKKNWDGTPFEYAEYSSEKIRQLIIAATQDKADPTDVAAREEMLRSAAFDGDADLVRELIHQGVNIDAHKPGNGWTALMFAAGEGNLTVVQLLLAAGADMNQMTAGKTALSEAVYWGQDEIISLLISAGADLDIADKDSGLTPLMKTVSWGYRTDILKMLLDAGADATLRAHNGKTVLAFALEAKNQEIIDVLHQAGVNE